MRVLHLVSTVQRRGGEIFAADLAAALDALDVDQHVAILRDGRGSRTPFPVPSTVLPGSGPKLPGLRVELASARSLRRLIRDWKPGVIQAHGGETLKYLLASRATRRLPVVYRRIGLAPPRMRRGLRRISYGALIRQATRIVAVGNALRREALEVFHVPPSRVITIPNAVDGTRMHPGKGREAVRRSLGVPLDAPVLLTVGALTWEKDPLANLELGTAVMGALPGAVQLFAGDGPLRGQVEQAIGHQGLGRRAILLGSRSDVPDLIAASDVLVLASAVEGMPGSAIEAGMMGVPVAAYSLAGIPEVVDDGVTGLLAPPGDISALARRVIEILSDASRARAMGEAARRRCRSLFDITSVAPRYLRLYEELVAL
jgi:glycosyltransferase involved in cell wall biosynthesis